MSQMHVIPVSSLNDFISAIFGHAGCEPEEAARVSRFLISANLAGHDSHGIIRVPRYVANLKDGVVFAGRSLTVVTDSAAHAVVDGNRGLGQTIGALAVDLGIGKAKANGLSVIALRNSGHIGRIGDWAERASEAGLVSIHFVNVALGEIVAPYGGVDRRFGTNPFCIGIPTAGGKPPLLLDMATSLVAEGKVLVASNGGKPVPDKSMVTPDGAYSSDPATLYGPLESGERNPRFGTGALCAFGDHKGSAIAFMCEILAGCLTGGATSGPVPGGRSDGVTNGMLSIYLDPDHFGSRHFVAQAQDYAEYVKSSRPAKAGAEVLVPGEPEARTREERTKNGVPVPHDVVASLAATAKRVGLDVPAPFLA